MLTHLLTAVVLAFAIAAVACTVSLAKIFGPARAAIVRREGKFVRWFAGLISCPYCVSHWLAFGATAIYRPTLVDLWLPLDLLVTAFAIIGMAMVGVLVIRRGLHSGAKIMLEQPASSSERTRASSRDELGKLVDRVRDLEAAGRIR